MSAIHAARVFSAASRVIAIIVETETSRRRFSFRNVCASWNESSCAPDSATMRLASGVVRDFPSSHPNFASALLDTPRFGAYGYRNGTRPPHESMLADRWHTVPGSLRDSATDDAIADICASASARNASVTRTSRSAAEASAGLRLNSAMTAAMLAQQMPTFSVRSFF